MSIRIHVVGAYGANEAEFRQALDSIADDGQGAARFRIGSSGRWMWANASVWHVDGSAIDAALGSLAVPALRVTSSDGVLWTLTLTRPGKPVFRGVCHFTSVGSVPEDEPPEEAGDDDFSDDEVVEIAGINRFIPELEFLWDAEEAARVSAACAAEAETTVPGLDEYSDYGVALPAPVIDEMKRHPHRAWHTALMAHGPQIVEALGEAGFDFDRAAMLDLLTIGPLTELERDSDLGNMPRFLQTLGIDGVFVEDAVDAVERDGEPETDDETAGDEASQAEPESAGVDWSQYPAGELFGKFESLRADCPLTTISGGPVEVEQPAMLALLPHLLADDPPMSVQLELPSEEIQPGTAWTELRSLEVRHDGRRWQFCFETMNWWFSLYERDGLKATSVSQAVGAPPDETRMEMCFLVDGLAERGHRYAGTFRNQRLLVDQAYPPVAADVLSDALALLARMFDMQPIDLASESETNAVRRDYERANEEPPRIRNGKVKPEEGTRGGVIQTLLFERFAGRAPWDIAAAREKVEEEWREYEELCNPPEQGPPPTDEELKTGDPAFDAMILKMRDATEQMKAAKVVPHSDEVVFEDRLGKTVRASLADLPHVSPQTLEEHDAALSRLGFHPLGDFTGDVSQR